MGKGLGWTNDQLREKGYVADKYGNWKPGKKGPVVPEKKEGNKKIKNATKVEFQGIKYDSQVELFMRQLFWKHDIPHEFKKRFILQEKFRYMGEAIREVAWEPDYIVYGNVIVDTKGFQTQKSKLQFKLFKRYCYDRGLEYKILTPKSKKQCQSVLLELIAMKHGK